MATGKDIIRRVRFRIVDEDGDGNDPRLSETFMRDALNEGVREWGRRTLSFERSTTLSFNINGESNAPADLYRPDLLFVEGREILLESRRRVRVERNRGGSRPVFFTVFGGKVLLGPKPGAAVTGEFDYYAGAPAAPLVNLNIETGLTAEHEDAAKEWMISEAWTTLGNRAKAIEARDKFDMLIEESEPDQTGLDVVNDVLNDVTQEFDTRGIV